MTPSKETIDWLLDSDPSLKWQVERDLLGLPEATWQATRSQVAETGFGAHLLSMQDEDGKWAGGAYFPKRDDPRAITHEDDEQGQPYHATTWTLNALREWGVDASALGDTAARLDKNCLWEYNDLPYWGGEVDCCINAFTLSNGSWLGVDVSKNAEWFLEHQLEDDGWNCEWENGDLRSSFHSTLNSLIGLLDYEIRVGKDERISAARKRGEEYLLRRNLLFKLSSGEQVGRWATEFISPPRWRYSTLRALTYFMDARKFDGAAIDPRLEQAIESVRTRENENGRWINDWVEKGAVWVETDAPIDEESKWNTFFAIRVLNWIDSAK